MFLVNFSAKTLELEKIKNDGLYKYEREIQSEQKSLINVNDNNVFVSDSALKAAQHADAILVLTEWEEFMGLDWKNIFEVMRKPAWVFDTRICLEKESLKNIGFKVWTLGTT